VWASFRSAVGSGAFAIAPGQCPRESGGTQAIIAVSRQGQSASLKRDRSPKGSPHSRADVTGAKNLGQQLIDAGMEQFRSSVQDSQPDNPRAKQFADAFVARFQKHFDPNSLTERVIPIYDKYLTANDLQGLLDYYHSPLGQRMLKALPEVTRESQAAGFALGQKAAQETMEELKGDFPEFTGAKEEDKHPGGDPQQN
jgi:hypothetical protein